MLKSWNLFEKLFLVIGTITAIVITIVFKCAWEDLAFTLMYFWSALFLAKGKYACYIIGVVSTFFYAYVSYKNAYYGEVIIAMCCTFPLMLFGLINWLRHQDDTNTVVIKDITKRELGLLLGSQVIMFFGYYFLLKAFNTNNLLVSTFSLVASFIASYLTARRSENGFIGFIINDLILIVLWGIPVVSGNYLVITALLCPILLLINDIYGVFNWRKIKEEQKEERNGI